MAEEKKIVEVNERVSENFLFSEFVCPCCDTLKIVPGFFRHVGLLQRMRDELGFPLVANSGYRCEKHNKEIGGAARSWHLLFATDLRPDDRDPEKLAAMSTVAERLGFTGIGRYETWLHVDLRPEPARWRG